MKKYIAAALTAIVFCFPLSAQEHKIPQMIIQQGHSGPINCAAVSPDEKYLATGSASDGDELKLWDLSLRKEIRTFTGIGKVNSICFSPDGKRMAAGTGSIHLWEVETGKKLLTIPKTLTYSLKFTPDGKYLAAGTDNGLILLDSFAGNIVRTFWTIGKCKTIAVSPDGKYIAADEFGKTFALKMWNIETGSVYRDFIMNARPEASYERAHRKEITSVAFSPDGKYLVSSSEWETTTLWDIASGKEIRTLNENRYAGTTLCESAFTPDGKKIVTLLANYVLVDDIASGKQRRLDIAGYRTDWLGHPMESLCFYGDKLVMANGQRTPYFINLETAAVEKPFIESSVVESVAWHGNLAAGAAGSDIYIWDMNTGKRISVLKDLHKILSIAFSPDGKTIAAGHYRGRVKQISLWDVKTGAQLADTGKLQGGGTDDVIQIGFFPNGKGIYAVYEWVNKILFFAVSPERLNDAGPGTVNWKDLKEIASVNIKNHEEPFSNDGNVNFPRSVDMSSDGNFLITGTSESTAVRLWDIKTGKRIKTFTPDQANGDPFREINHVSFSADGKKVTALIKDKDTTLYTWDASNGTIIAKHNLGGITGSDGGHVSLSPDRKKILGSSPYGSINIIDIESGKTVWETRKDEYSKASLAFSSHDGFVLLGCKNGAITLCSTRTADRVSMLSNNASDEWLIFDNEGYWDSSPGGGSLVVMINDLHIFNIDQFAVRTNRPDLVIKKTPAPDKTAAAHYYSQYLRRLKKLGISDQSANSDYHAPVAEIKNLRVIENKAELDVVFSDSKYNLKRYNVFINDVPLFGSAGKAVSSQQSQITEKILLSEGENKIEVSCVNEKETESLRSLANALYERPDQNTKGSLYYIGFGVSKYKDERLNLKYADKDATDLAELFGKMKNSYDNIFINTFTNEQCTVDSIKKAKRLLKDAGPDDTLVLFIAGHGIHDRDKDSTYYYITHETDINRLSATAANFEIIEDIVQGIAPRNKLFLMDTCESGEIEEDIQLEYFAAAESQGLKPRALPLERGLKVTAGSAAKTETRSFLLERDRYIFNDLARRSGAIVFSSSRGGEFSYESDAVGNGFFTFEIKNALHGMAKTRNSAVPLNSLKEYVKNAVAVLSAGKQNPVVDRDNLYQKFSFPVLYDFFDNDAVNPAEKPMSGLVIKHNQTIKVAYSPDNKQVATASEDGYVKLWEVSTGAELATISSQEDPSRFKIENLLFSPDGSRLYTLVIDYNMKYGSNFLFVYDLQSGNIIKKLPKQKIPGLLAASGGDFLVTYSNSAIAVNDAIALKNGKSLNGKEWGKYDAVGINRDTGDILVFNDEYPNLYFDSYNHLTGKQNNSKVIPNDFAAQLMETAYSPDGKYAVLGFHITKGPLICRFHLVDSATGASVRVFSDNEVPSVKGLLFSSDSRLLLSGIGSKTLTLWTIKAGQKIKSIEVEAPVLSAAFSSNSRYLVYTTGNETKIIDVSTLM